MVSHLPVIDDDDEVGDLSEVDPALFKPFSALPASLQDKLLKISKRGPNKAPTKKRISIRLSAEVVEKFRASGAGWQTRMDAALQDWLKTHSVA
jgi:uncharacterized protein (DUF4415 family)